MKKADNIENVLGAIFEKSSLILAALSSPHKGIEISKAVIRPIQIQGKLTYQITEHRQEKAVHHNYSPEMCLSWLKQHFTDFKQTYLYTREADYHLLIGKKGNATCLRKAPSKVPHETGHNRQKNYIWKEGEPIPFLARLGVMNSDGKVFAAKQDKFRQINRFLEMIDDILPHLDRSQVIRIVDFGCGKAYLTFALYHFLTVTKSYQVRMIGLDLKQDVIEFCQNLAQQLGCGEGLAFVRDDINTFVQSESVDLVVSLHACDTATDAALEKAVRWQAKVILSVPCCQHELMNQINQNLLKPILKHGILKERFAALATDAARVQLLDVLGYQTQIMEFIDIENTPKNLLIRAVRQTHPGDAKEAWEAYLKFKQTLNIFPSLERRFQAELPQ